MNTTPTSKNSFRASIFRNLRNIDQLVAAPIVKEHIPLRPPIQVLSANVPPSTTSNQSLTKAKSPFAGLQFTEAFIGDGLQFSPNLRKHRGAKPSRLSHAPYKKSLRDHRQGVARD